MKNIVFIILIFNLIFISTRDQDEDKILWNKNINLTWDDFKGKPVTKEKRIHKTAMTISNIEITADFYEGELPKFDVKAFFLRNESWSITNSKQILIHERIHFDISELYARKIRKVFDSLYVKECHDISLYEKKFHKLNEECVKYNSLYDNEVYFNVIKQQEWIDKITRELETLKYYKYIGNGTE